MIGPGKLDKLYQSAFGDIRTSQIKPQAGWLFPYLVSPVLVTSITDNGGTVAQSGSFAQLSTGTDPAGTARIQTNRTLHYVPGVGAICRFTVVFGTPQENSTQLVGIGDDLDGFFFGYDGTRFGILKRRAGVDEWTYQDAWNRDTRSDLDPEKGNVYEIKYQWLGFGDQFFSIEKNGVFSSVHQIEYSNTATNVSVENPNFSISAEVKNDGNTTDISLKTPSAMAGTEGENFAEGAFTSAVGIETTVSVGANTETFVLSIQNPTTYQGKSNRLLSRPLKATFAAEGTKPVLIRIYANSIITGGAFNDVNPFVTPLQANTTATGWSNGIFTLPIALSKTGNEFVNLTDVFGYIPPGGNFTVTAFSTNATEIFAGTLMESFI